MISYKDRSNSDTTHYLARVSNVDVDLNRWGHRLTIPRADRKDRRKVRRGDARAKLDKVTFRYRMKRHKIKPLSEEINAKIKEMQEKAFVIEADDDNRSSSHSSKESNSKSRSNSKSSSVSGNNSNNNSRSRSGSVSDDNNNNNSNSRSRSRSKSNSRDRSRSRSRSRSRTPNKDSGKQRDENDTERYASEEEQNEEFKPRSFSIRKTKKCVSFTNKGISNQNEVKHNTDDQNEDKINFDDPLLNLRRNSNNLRPYELNDEHRKLIK